MSTLFTTARVQVTGDKSPAADATYALGETVQFTHDRLYGFFSITESSSTADPFLALHHIDLDLDANRVVVTGDLYPENGQHATVTLTGGPVPASAVSIQGVQIR